MQSTILEQISQAYDLLGRTIRPCLRVACSDADYVYSVKSHVNIGRGINGYNGSFDSVEEANRFAQAVAYTPNPSTQGLCFTGQEVSKYWALLSNGSHCYIAHGPAGGKIVAWVDRGTCD